MPLLHIMMECRFRLQRKNNKKSSGKTNTSSSVQAFIRAAMFGEVDSEL